MAARKAAAKKAAPAETERTSTTRGQTVAEVTAESAGDDSRGYFGETPDPTPNENYTVDGVLAGKAVPEHDRMP